MSIDHEANVATFRTDHNILVCDGRHNSLGLIDLFRLLLNFGHLIRCFNREEKLLLRYCVEFFFLAYRRTHLYTEGGW
jgi:hypothetical protein